MKLSVKISGGGTLLYGSVWVRPIAEEGRLLKARAVIDDELRRQKLLLTVLFTDLVGSSSYFDRYGDTAGLALVQRHAELAAPAVAEFGGRVIKTIGDSVMASSTNPWLRSERRVRSNATPINSTKSCPQRECHQPVAKDHMGRSGRRADCCRMDRSLAPDSVKTSGAGSGTAGHPTISAAHCAQGSNPEKPRTPARRARTTTAATTQKERGDAADPASHRGVGGSVSGGNPAG